MKLVLVCALPLLAACTGGKDSDSAAALVPASTVQWVTPSDGASVAAGDVACSIAADNFTLSDPAKHNEGTPVGYISVSVDGVEVQKSGTTTPTVTLGAGSHSLMAQLFSADGDEVLTDGTYVCEEGDTSASCGPVSATITVDVTAAG